MRSFRFLFETHLGGEQILHSEVVMLSAPRLEVAFHTSTQPELLLCRRRDGTMLRALCLLQWACTVIFLTPSPFPSFSFSFPFPFPHRFFPCNPLPLLFVSVSFPSRFFSVVFIVFSSPLLSPFLISFPPLSASPFILFPFPFRPFPFCSSPFSFSSCFRFVVLSSPLLDSFLLHF